LGQLFGPSDFGAALFIKGYKRIGPYNKNGRERTEDK